jgi:hypothetical protein
MPIVRLPNSYLCTDAYAGFIDRNHFLARLAREFDWHDLAEPLKALGSNDAGGRPRNPAVLMLKMTFVSFLFDLSDRGTEFACTDDTPRAKARGISTYGPMPAAPPLDKLGE